MIVFAIINLASKNPDAPETLAFQIIACIILIISSVLSTVLVVAKDPHHFDARLVVVNGLLLGTGIFVVLPEASAAADILVGYFIPSLLVGVGAFFIIATIISLVNKINKRNTDILALVIGIIMLVIGILLQPVVLAFCAQSGVAAAPIVTLLNSDYELGTCQGLLLEAFHSARVQDQLIGELFHFVLHSLQESLYEPLSGQ